MIIKNARLIPELTEGYTEAMGDILIKDNVIMDIKPCGFDFGGDAEIIDAAGQTVMPGLMDIHTHLSAHSLEIGVMNWHGKNIGQELFDSYDHAMAYVKQGYTTLRDLSSIWDVQIYIRDAINTGRLPGPRLFVSSDIITPTEIGNDWFEGLYTVCDSPDAVRKAAREHVAKGVDVIKYLGSGAMLNPGGKPGLQIGTRAEFEALTEIANMHHKPTAVHCHGASGIATCIDVGVTTIEHATLITEDLVERLIKNETSYLVPTYSPGVARMMNACGCDWNKFDCSNAKIKEHYRLMKLAADAGLHLGMGSDIGEDMLIKVPALEIIGRKLCSGFSNLELLKQCTINSAICIGQEETIGTLKVGKFADIIITDGNPDEDIFVLAKPMIHVICNGKVLV